MANTKSRHECSKRVEIRKDSFPLLLLLLLTATATTTATAAENQNNNPQHQPGDGGLGLGALCWAMLRKKLDKRIELRRSDWTGRRSTFGGFGVIGFSALGFRFRGLTYRIYGGLAGFWVCRL